MVPHPGEQGHSRSARRLNEPRPVQVVCEGRVPAAVDRVPVIAYRDEWHVADRWWTEEPVRRNDFEVVLETGRNVVVFRDEASGSWFRQAS